MNCDDTYVTHLSIMVHYLHLSEQDWKSQLSTQGVSNGLCEHACTAFYFVSTSSDPIRLEHLRQRQMASSEHLVLNSRLIAISFFLISHVVCQVYCFNIHAESIVLRITHMLTFVFYFILVCFQLNLTVRFKGVQYHVETHLFLYQKT